MVDCAAGRGSVELRRYPLEHPFAQLQGSDNIIAFTTQRYKSQPLIVRRAARLPHRPMLLTGSVVQGSGSAMRPCAASGRCWRHFSPHSSIAHGCLYKMQHGVPLQLMHV